MKTRPFLLICLFLCFALARLSAQTKTFAYRFTDTPGTVALSCDGVKIEYINITCDFHWLLHCKDDLAVWVKVNAASYNATSSTGETFNVKEFDPGIEFYDENGFRSESGTIRFTMVGDRGSFIRVTWAYSITFDPNDPEYLVWKLSFLDAKCH